MRARILRRKGEAMTNKAPITFPPAILDFIYRRSTRFIERHKSLETMVAGAYIQGVLDALERTRKD